uniref:Uncharacterized protein n=1 Tax=Paramormyrops kingsleyae TaxID=1676925 RepID=A0A3B3SVV3_9TELE
MSQVQERRSGDEDDLQHPEADMRDGEGLVVTDVLTAGLLGVALEGRLLVPPGTLHRGAQHQDAEDEEHRQPDLPPGCGVGLDLSEANSLCAPTHG